MSSQFRDHVGLFLLHLLEEDPRILSLCSVSDLASIYSQEMQCELDDALRRDFIRTFCSIVCDILNCQQEISRNRRSSKNSRCIPHPNASGYSGNPSEKALPPRVRIPDVGRRVLLVPPDTMLAPDDVDSTNITLCEQQIGAVSPNPRPTESDLSARKPCNSPLRQEQPAYSLQSINNLKPSAFSRSMSPPCVSPSQPPPVFSTRDNVLPSRPVVLSVQIPSLGTPLRLPQSSEQFGTDRSPVLATATSSSTVRCLSTLPLSGSPTTQQPSIRQPSDSPPYITVKRKLSEVVVSIRPAQSRLMEET